MKIYVGNMSFNSTADSLRSAFEAFGTVEDVSIITDRDTGRPRGFAFITMPNKEEAEAAINGLNETSIDGRSVSVNEAKPRASGGGGGRGGDRGGRGGGGGGGDRRDRW